MKKNSSDKSHSRLLARAGVAAWALAIIGALTAVTFYSRLILPTNQMAAVITSALVNLTNKDRNEEALGILRVNPLLVAAAQAKANDMADKGYFAHNSPDGKTSWYWFGQAGYGFSHAGENLAVNFSDSVDVERAWMNSPTHRANILNGKFTEIGIATAVGEYQGKKTVFVVQMFGTPSTIVAQTPVEEVIPENPEEIALATTESAPTVLGTEVEDEPVRVAASVSPAAEEPTLQAVETVEPTVASEIVPTVETLATSPKTLLRTLYLLAAAVLLVIFGLITRLEFKRNHSRHIVAVGLLFVLMTGLFVAADRFLFPTPVIGQEISP